MKEKLQEIVTLSETLSKVQQQFELSEVENIKLKDEFHSTISKVN